MTDLRTLLDDLVDDVHADDLDPDALWRTGSRRRAARRAATVVALAGVLLAVLVLVQLRPAPPSADTPADPGHRITHPQRIGHQVWVPDLPDAPGPMAAVAEVRTGDHETRFEVVSPDGHRFVLPGPGDLDPALSPDGRLLAYGGADRLVHVRDLVAGTDRATRLPGQVLVRADDPRAAAAADRPQVSPQIPMFFSPDGSRLAVQWGSPVVVDPRGAVHELRGLRNGPGDITVPGAVHRRTVGWFDDATLAVVETTTGRAVRLLRVDAGTGATTPGPWLRTPPAVGSQLTWSLSPDGRSLARHDPDRSDEVLVVSTTTGTVTSTRRTSAGDDVPVVWVGGVPALWGEGGLVPAAPATTTGAATSWHPLAPVVVTDLDVDRLWPATDAQDPTPALLGTTDTWLAWWWRELLAGAAAVAALLAWRARRRARSR